MKKFHLFFIIAGVLVLVSVIALIYLSVSAPQSTSFEVAMYGAEVELDGTVIRDIEFNLSGKIIQSKDRLFISLNPLTLYNNYSVSMEHDCILYPELSEIGYYAGWLTYLSSENRYAPIQMGLSRDLDSCIFILSPTRYFIGSTDPMFDPHTILEQFQYITPSAGCDSDE